MTPLMISLLVFLAVSALIGVLFFVFAGDSTRANERLDIVTGRKKREDPAASIVKHEAFESDKKSLLALLTPNLPSLKKVIAQADANVSASTLFGLGIVFGVMAASLALMAGVKIYYTPIAGLIMFSIPFAWLFFKRSMRMGAFASQLSDALELVARALRAGHSLQAGLHVVAEEMPGPINEEFRRVYEEQNLGISMEDSLKNLCERVPNLDLRFFVTSVLVQRQTGGDLAEILDKIGYVVRERYRILGQVKALTAEGRLSGIILIALPFGLFFLMIYIKPDYIERLWTHPLGIKMSVFALIAQLLGALVIKKIVTIKV